MTRWSDLDPRAVEFLGKVGTGVVGARLRRVEVSEKEEFLQGFHSLMERAFGNPADARLERDSDPHKVEFAHRGRDGAEVYFDLDDESDGTRQLVKSLTPAFRALDIGSLMVVDELDASLHTQACEALLALFASPKTNPKGAQLIATTHDTNLLRSPFLRRDEVWFTEKDVEGATHLYPLTDFRYAQRRQSGTRLPARPLRRNPLRGFPRRYHRIRLNACVVVKRLVSGADRQVASQSDASRCFAKAGIPSQLTSAACSGRSPMR